jgi:hypothetical protein
MDLTYTKMQLFNFEKFIIEERSQESGAWLQSPLIDDYTKYKEGYQESYKVIYKSIKENSSLENILIYPLIFNFLHCIELSLKNIIIKLNDSIQPKILYKEDHNLQSLSNLVFDNIFTVIEKKLVQEIDVKQTKKFLQEFQLFDDGFATRYPFSKIVRGANPTIAMETIDYEVFYSTADSLMIFFDYIEQLIDNKQG